MGLGSYVVGGVALVTGFFFLVQPPLDEGGINRWWGSLWQSHHIPSAYQKLPLFGIPADIRLSPSHHLFPNGLHSSYKISIGMRPERDGLAGCLLSASWPIPKELIVDPWILRRLTDLPWTVTDLIDIEAPAYSTKAKEYLLSVSVPISALAFRNATSTLTIEIPDIVSRYQLISSPEEGQYGEAVFPVPQLTFTCDDQGEFHQVQRELVVAFDSDESFIPLRIKVPIVDIQLAPLVNFVTILLMTLCPLHLLWRISQVP